MTYETWENLKQANDRRRKAAVRAGNWKVVAECSEESVRLDDEYARTNSNALMNTIAMFGSVIKRRD
jgi:hypothetical protein